MNCPDVKNYGNGAQILARCALGEVNDGVAEGKYYFYVECNSPGMPDNNYNCATNNILFGLIPTLNFYNILK